MTATASSSSNGVYHAWATSGPASARSAARSATGSAIAYGRSTSTASEWPHLDDCFRITISRFYRDRHLWEVLGRNVLPELFRRAVYPESCLRDLPAEWQQQAFTREPAGEYCLAAPYRQGVDFLLQDIRREAPPGPFDLIPCRNLVSSPTSTPTPRNTA